MNNIVVLQNNQSALEELAAQRRLYSEGKFILLGRGLLALLIAIIFPFIANKYPDAGFWLGIGALTYFAIDILFLGKAETNKKSLAAKIQEKFDTDVLNIRWNLIVTDEKPDPEDISSYSEKIFQKEVAKLRDWYPAKVSGVPEDVAKTICQRSNVSWDSRLRRFYANIFLVVIVISLVVAVCIVKDKTVANAFVVLAPFVPLFKLLLEQFLSHRESANRVEKLKIHLSSILEGILADPSKQVDEETTRSIQDEIYRHRISNSPIPNFFYNFLKERYEKDMNFSANDFIARYLANRI